LELQKSIDRIDGFEKEAHIRKRLVYLANLIALYHFLEKDKANLDIWM
jgi:hypothetical protein